MEAARTDLYSAHMDAAAVAPARPRRAHAVRNDALLRDAAIERIAIRGWDALTVSEIGPAAGLTHGAVYARFSHKRELGTALWREALGDALCGALEQALAAGLDAQDGDGFQAAMTAFHTPDRTLLAGLEVLLAARHDTALAAAVEADLHALIRRWCRPHRGRSPSAAARASAVLFAALGLALVSQFPWVPQADIEPALARLHRVLSHPAEPRSLPPIGYEHVRDSPFDTGDARLDTLYDATAACVGDLGYDAATVSRICRQAHISQGYVFSRFATKLDLFVTVIDLMQPKGMADTQAFVARVEADHGLGIADAVTWREYQHPDIALQRNVVLESMRLARYDDRMRALLHPKHAAFLDRLATGTRGRRRSLLFGELHLSYAIGHGILIPCDLAPRLWQLPFNCVTEPLAAGSPLATLR